ncbi:unnamed protein product [Tenebrio molitor]|nr:unnamed protein product [Tenebrio molitor]
MEDVLTEMVKAIKNTRTAPDQIDLPLFHPDGDDASSWLRKVEEVKDEFSWSDLQILVRVGRFLTDDDLPSGSWIALLVSFESEAPVSLAVLDTSLANELAWDTQPLIVLFLVLCFKF